MNSYHLNNCLSCGSNKLVSTLDLGLQPAANNYLNSENDKFNEFPLELMRCLDCWHSQLSFCVDRNYIFDNYNYVSGTSNTLIKYFEWFSSNLRKLLKTKNKVLEIASNDGSLLKCLEFENFECIGIDPASNILENSNNNNTICGYWPKDSYKINDKFDAIICLNVIAHVNNPLEFLKECTNKLNDGGIIILQPSQARMFENGEFDTCYHEHLSFFNSKSINTLANRAGLELVDARLVKIHGDSPIYFLAKLNSISLFNLEDSFSNGDFSINDNLFEYEKRISLYDNETYMNFNKKSHEVLRELIENIKIHKKLGYKIAYVGAAAKGLTVINAIKVKPDYFFDESTYKIGKVAPGINCIISPLSECSNIQDKIFFIFTAWNFKDELIKKIKLMSNNKEHIFYNYFPKSNLIKL